MNGEASRGAAEARRVRRVVVPWFTLAAWAVGMAFWVWMLFWAMAWLPNERADFDWFQSLVMLALWAPYICWFPVIVFSERGILVARGLGLWRRRVAWEEVRHVMVTKFGGLPSVLLVVQGSKMLDFRIRYWVSWDWRRCERLLRERGVEVRGVAMATRSVE